MTFQEDLSFVLQQSNPQRRGVEVTVRSGHFAAARHCVGTSNIRGSSGQADGYRGSVDVRQAGGLINVASLLRASALTPDAQPYLTQLFAAVRSVDRPLVLVLGAGVAVNAGLPSWNGLVDNLCNMIDDEPIRRMVQADQSNPLRKAELVLQLLLQQRQTWEEHAFVRDALFPEAPPALPGPILKALARLVAVSYERRPTFVLTTNFDELFEDALTAIIPPDAVGVFGLDDADEWRGFCADGNVGVMHLHGVLRARRQPLEPLILTESTFLKHGKVVRDLVGATLKGADAIFVGLSLTDPNLVGPLHDLVPSKPSDLLNDSSRAREPAVHAGDDSRYFAITTADLGPDDPADRHTRAQFAVESAKFLDERLGLKPILLKSFSQVAQLVSDLGLIVHEASMTPGNSGRRRAPVSYLDRLNEALSLLYQCLCTEEGPPFVLGRDDSAKLTGQLRKALDGPKGIRELLVELADQYSGPGADDVRPEDEHFGLFLWLRTIDDTKSTSRYEVQLVGSSVYDSYEPWYGKPSEAIHSESKYASAMSIYGGRTVKTNLESPGPWRGVVAVPIVLLGWSSDLDVNGELLDRVIVGAITLDSNYQVRRPDPKSGHAPAAPGILTRIDADDLERLSERIQDSVQRCLGWVLTEDAEN